MTSPKALRDKSLISVHCLGLICFYISQPYQIRPRFKLQYGSSLLSAKDKIFNISQFHVCFVTSLVPGIPISFSCNYDESFQIKRLLLKYINNQCGESLLCMIGHMCSTYMYSHVNLLLLSDFWICLGNQKWWNIFD